MIGKFTYFKKSLAIDGNNFKITLEIKQILKFGNDLLDTFNLTV